MASTNTGGAMEKRAESAPQKTQQSEAQEPSRAMLTRSGPSRSPFAMMRSIFDEMDRVFGNFGLGAFDDFGGLLGGMETPWARTRDIWMPQIDVREKDGKLSVRADLPGLDSKDVNVNIEDDTLTISGERRNEYEGTEHGVHRSERSYGRFERRIALPQGIDPNQIDAHFENGVLEITAPIPKREPRGRKIEVKGAEAKPLGTGSSPDPKQQKQSH